jgi:hypothetical protein
MVSLPGGGTEGDVLEAAWLVEPGTLRMAPMVYVPALTGNHAAHIVPQNFHRAALPLTVPATMVLPPAPTATCCSRSLGW